MNMPSVDVKDILEEESSLALTFGTDLYINREPKIPDDCVTIFDTPGSTPAMTMADDSYYYPSVNIRVRGAKSQDAMSLAQSIRDKLHGRSHETINDTYYSVMICSEPSLLDWDENNRARYIINVEIQRR
jgi:hypothetical protein